MKVPNQQQLVLGPQIEQVWAEGHHPVQNKGRNSSQRLSTVLAIAARVAWNGPAWRTQRIQWINYENSACNANIHLLSIVISSMFTRLHEWGVQGVNIWTSGGGITGRSRRRRRRRPRQFLLQQQKSLQVCKPSIRLLAEVDLAQFRTRPRGIAYPPWQAISSGLSRLPCLSTLSQIQECLQRLVLLH